MRPALASMPPDHRLGRLAILAGGLTLYGFSDGLLVRAGLGLDPWDVLHQGLTRAIGLQVGTWSVLVGAVVLLAWIPLRQRPGFGTVCNVATVGSVLDVTLALTPAPQGLAARAAVLATGVALNGVATGAYIGAGLGPGPRDGLSTAIAERGHSLRMVRTAVEATVLAIGWSLGGSVGVGTIVYALAIGPLVHLTVPLLRFRIPDGRPPAPADRARGSQLLNAPGRERRPTPEEDG